MIDKAMAVISYNGDFYKIISMSNAVVRFREPESKPIYLDKNASELLLGQSILHELTFCKNYLLREFDRMYPQILEANNEIEQLELKTYGYKNTKNLYTNSIQCDFNFCKKNSQFEISPTHHEKLEEYSGLGLSFNISSNSTANEIGDAVKKGLRLCTANKKFGLPIIL